MSVELLQGMNWWERLEWAEKNGVEPESPEHKFLKALAHEWPTCACGELCKDLPRDEGVPEDNFLFALGCHFYDGVDYCEWADARRLFKEIEARTDELLAEQNGASVERQKTSARNNA